MRSKHDTAMRNEVLCKFLCHNICCVIMEQCVLGIDPVFWPEGAAGRTTGRMCCGSRLADAERLSGIGLDLPTLGAYPQPRAISPEGVRGSAASIPPRRLPFYGENMSATAILSHSRMCEAVCGQGIVEGPRRP